MSRAVTDRPQAPAAAEPHPELRRFEHGPFRFHEPDLYDRHLLFDSGAEADRASGRERFEALARSLRDVLTQRWVQTREHATRRRTPSRSTTCRWSSSSAGR